MLDSEYFFISDDVKREITEGLKQGHGAEKGIAYTSNEACEFFDFETCEIIHLSSLKVRCIK